MFSHFILARRERKVRSDAGFGALAKSADLGLHEDSLMSSTTPRRALRDTKPTRCLRRRFLSLQGLSAGSRFKAQSSTGETQNHPRAHGRGSRLFRAFDPDQLQDVRSASRSYERHDGVPLVAPRSRRSGTGCTTPGHRGGGEGRTVRPPVAGDRSFRAIADLTLDTRVGRGAAKLRASSYEGCSTARSRGHLDATAKTRRARLEDSAPRAHRRLSC